MQTIWTVIKFRQNAEPYFVGRSGRLLANKASQLAAVADQSKVLGKVAPVVSLVAAKSLSQVGGKFVGNVVGGAGIEPATSAL